jgi:parallel beta-helix repeat protein
MTFQPTLRLTKGSRLTFQEMDDNWQGLADAIGDSVTSSEYVTLEQFNAAAGSGGDDTAAFDAAIAQAKATGKTVLFLSNKTYLVEPKPSVIENYIEGPIKFKGMGGSLVKARSRLGLVADYMVFAFKGDGIQLDGVNFDGNISDDPEDWVTGYNSFQGTHGIRFSECTNTRVENCTVSNAGFAGFAWYRGHSHTVKDCRTNRTRGNFGDGFYMASYNFHSENCYAYDFTRIGWVVETNSSATRLSGDGNLYNFKAEYGHDGSIEYGGAESNVGFWFENYINVNVYGGWAKDMQHRGCNFVPSAPIASEPWIVDKHYTTTHCSGFTLYNCGTYGFVVRHLNENYYPMVHLDSCTAYDAQIFAYQSDDGNNETPYYGITKVTNCSVVTSTANIATVALMNLKGEMYVENFTIRYDVFDQVLWDDATSYYGVIGHFGSDCGYKFYGKNIRAYDASNVEFPIRTKFLASSRAINDITLEDCWVDQLINRGKNITYTNCRFENLGADDASERVLYKDCVIFDTQGSGDIRQPVIAKDGMYDILFDACIFDMVESGGYVFPFNESRVTDAPFVRFKDCRFIKNFEVDSHIIRINASTTLKTDQNDVFNIEISGCTFENTGGTTTNPILFTDGVNQDRFKVFGVGNTKSATLSVDVSPTLIPALTIAPFGFAKPNPVAITASRNIISNDFNKVMQNSTASAYVLTMGVNQELLAPIGTEITLTKMGTGDISFTPTAPTTVNGTTTFAVTTQYSSRTIRKIAADAWVTV